MNTPWSDFLQTRPAQSHPAAPDCALNDLSHFGLLQVVGEDAMPFLQGQLTNDMREVTEQHANLSGWCSAKGRMLANFRVFRRAGVYLLQPPLEQLEAIMKRLRMYVLRSKVTITDVSDQWVRMGITGACAPQLLQARYGSLPSEPNETLLQGECLLVCLPGSVPRYEVIGPSDELTALWQAGESAAGVRMDDDFWALQEIRAGIPTVYAATSEAFVPQMTNMQLVDGVSFTKGCYTGQEVVARMQYLGKLKRRMYLAHVQSDKPPVPGDELFAAGSSSGQGTGKVVDARPAGEGYDLLAVIEISSAEQQQVHLGEDGPPLEILPLPYAFASESN